MRKVGILLLLGFVIMSCGEKRWAENYKYVASKGWSKEQYVNSKLPPPPQKQKTEKETSIEKEKKMLVKKLIKSPPTPLKLPDKVLRVLVLPWVDAEGNLHTQEYLFTKVEEGKWIIGNYMLNEKRIPRRLTPLEEKDAD